MRSLLQDLRFAGRLLVRSPGLSLVIILTLALGIGANAAIFSVVNGVLLSPLPYHASASLFKVLGVHPERGRVFTAQEDLPNAEQVIVLGDGLWSRAFGGDPLVALRSE